jgi:hypothetical protein
MRRTFELLPGGGGSASEGPYVKICSTVPALLYELMLGTIVGQKLLPT